MLRKRRIPIFILLVLVLYGCTWNDPEVYFDRTTLTTNKFFSFGAKDFEQMRNLKKSNALYANLQKDITTTNSYEQHIRTYKIPEIEADIQKIKALKVTEDTKEMIRASLEVFNFVKRMYETDYLKIAQLMDTKAARKDINAAVTRLEEENAPLLDEKVNALMQMALPYAREHGIRVERY